MSDDTKEEKLDIPDEIHWPKGFEKWNPLKLGQIGLYFGVCLIGLMLLPNPLYDPELKQITFAIGLLGLWRYGWWFTHAIRAVIYGRFVYPKMRDRGEAAWADGWRPRHLHFMMTTYHEHKEITERVVRSILGEVRTSGVPATIWLGTSDSYDEDIIIALLQREAPQDDVTLRIVRQSRPGKRAAIGCVLRAMRRAGTPKDDLVVFMDGDFILAPNAIRRCLPLFKVFPTLQACTTDEEVICIGPKWVGTWLTMRFSQRRLAMQSHALSGRVLTLTGRMSVFRAHHVTKMEFIRLLEDDHLEHWLWGRFRFLSGDDKSTWYYLLKNNAHMLYVPDALGYTVEVIEGSGMDRMVQNFRRWSGNMLRNGSRAINLGPRAMPFFIWWCLIDQRISMWTMLVSPVLAVSATLLHSPAYILSYVVFIAFSRMALCMVLFTYSREVNLAYPPLLYFNQLINASVKVYCYWRLSKQRWSNRGNQSAGIGGSSLKDRYQNGMAAWCTTFSVCVLFAATIAYTGLIELPTIQFVKVAFAP